MSLSNAELDVLARDLSPKLTGGTIERIDQPDVHDLILNIRKGPRRYWLLLSTHPRFSRMHLLTHRPAEGAPATGFCKVVRQHVTASPVLALRKVPGDRIVILETQERDQLMRAHPVSLVAELMGPASRLLLLDQDRRVLAATGRATPPQGDRYEFPDAPEELPPQAFEDRFSESADPEDPLALSRAVQVAYATQEAQEEFEHARIGLHSVLNAGLRRARRRLRRQASDLELAENAEDIRHLGELLKIALPRVQKGQESVTVQDFFDPGAPEVTIGLDPALSPADNVKRLFQTYKKAKAGRDRLVEIVEVTRTEVATLEDLAAQLAAASTLDDLAAVQKGCRATGIRFPDEKKRAERKEGRSGPRRFLSADGFEILVSRSARENDRLTFTLARGNDHWVHLLGWPGPHVVVRKPSDREVTGEALLDAAHLAVHFSRIRGAEKAEVVHTQVKFIRKVKGGPPGRVNYADATTMYLRIEPDRMRRLLASRSGDQ